MEEVLPGIYRWSAFSEEKGYDFNGYLVISEQEPEKVKVLIDPPPLTAEDLAWLRQQGPIACILLTNRDHVREAGALRGLLSTRVLIHDQDAPLIDLKADGTFQDGDRLPGGMLAVHVPDNKSPGETALYLEGRGGRRGVMILGDALIGRPPGQLSLMPADKYADAARAREGLRVLLKYDYDPVLLGDGTSILKEGKKAVEQFINVES